MHQNVVRESLNNDIRTDIRAYVWDINIVISMYISLTFHNQCNIRWDSEVWKCLLHIFLPSSNCNCTSSLPYQKSLEFLLSPFLNGQPTMLQEQRLCSWTLWHACVSTISPSLTTETANGLNRFKNLLLISLTVHTVIFGHAHFFYMVVSSSIHHCNFCFFLIILVIAQIAAQKHAQNLTPTKMNAHKISTPNNLHVYSSKN